MIMKKLIITAAVIAALSPAAFADTIEITINSPVVYTQGKTVEKSELDAAAYIENDITMIPLRFVSEKLGATVTWNGEEKEVICEKDGKKVGLKIGDVNAYKTTENGTETVVLPAEPIILNDLTLVPLRFVSEGLGADVEYVATTKQVLISDYSSEENKLGGLIATVGNRKIDGGILSTYYKMNMYYLPYYGAEGYLNTIYENLANYEAIASELEKLGDTSVSTAVGEAFPDYSDDDLAADGILKANLAKIYELSNIVQAAGNKMSEELDESSINEYYKNNYVCAKHILLLTQDQTTGAPLEDKEKAQVKKKADDILKKLKKGENFDTLMSEYSEDPGSKANPNGYVFTKGEMVSEFEKTAFELEEGKISDIIETQYGYHIIKKEALPEITDDLKKTIASAFVNEKLSEIASGVTVQMHTTLADIYDEITPEEYKTSEK